MVSAAQWNDDLVEHGFAEVDDDVRLHYVVAGDGPLVVLLHGFPEFWYSWRHQIPALVDAGYRVVAPDLRGYNLSSKPQGVANYRVERLAQDVANLIAELGHDDATVVGHDWGGMVAWVFAMRHTAMLRRLVIMNCPHPSFNLRMMRNVAQLRRSWYMLFFQLPAVPEFRIKRDGYADIRALLRRDTERDDAFSESELDRYIEALSQPGAAEAMFNYYRALLRRNPFSFRSSLTPIEKPVQVIWGAKDRHLGQEYARPMPRWTPDLRFDLIEDASHWVQVDRPDRVNDALLAFLGPPADQSRARA